MQSKILLNETEAKKSETRLKPGAVLIIPACTNYRDRRDWVSESIIMCRGSGWQGRDSGRGWYWSRRQYFGPPTVVLAIASCSLFYICRSTENSTDNEAELVPGHMPPPPVLFVPSSPAPRMRVPHLRLQLPYMVIVDFEVFVSRPPPAVSNWRFFWSTSSWSWWLCCRTCFVCSLKTFSCSLAFSNSILRQLRDSFCCSTELVQSSGSIYPEREREREREREGERKRKGMKEIQ